MAMITCRECGKEFSDKADKCPNCGAPTAYSREFGVSMLDNLQSKIHPHAFEYIRGQMGIKDLSDLYVLLNLPKDDIEYNKFDK